MHRLLAAAALLLALAVPARAENPLDAKLSYSAECTVTVDGHSFKGTVFHEPGRERHEERLLGMKEVLILDDMRKAAILMLPSLKTYVAIPFPPLLDALLASPLPKAADGHEIIDHIPTAKYRIEKTAPDGTRGEGFAWISRRGVLMKLAGTVTSPGGHKTVIGMVLSDLKVAPQRQALFAVPAGFHQLPAAALAPLLSAKLR